MKNLAIIVLMLTWEVSYSQCGFLLERDYNEEYFNIGLLITSNDEKHVFGVSKSIVFGPSGINNKKLGYGYMFGKNSYPFIEIAYGRRSDTQPNHLRLTIGYTYKGLHLGYDFRDGLKLGYYPMFFRKNELN